MSQLHHRIARLRKQRGFTMLQLAKRVEVSEAYISMLESGAKKNPSLRLLRSLARALKVSLAELMQ
jgi:XRE family transcriptional regulator, master regulator for biofilm formation